MVWNLTWEMETMIVLLMLSVAILVWATMYFRYLLKKEIYKRAANEFKSTVIKELMPAYQEMTCETYKKVMKTTAKELPVMMAETMKATTKMLSEGTEN